MVDIPPRAPEQKGLGRVVLIGISIWIFIIFCFLILAIFIDWQ